MAAGQSVDKALSSDEVRSIMKVPSFSEAVRETASKAQQQVQRRNHNPDDATHNSHPNNSLDADVAKHINESYAVDGERGIYNLANGANSRMRQRGELAEAQGTLKIEMVNKDGSLRPLDKKHHWTAAKDNPAEGYQTSLFDSHGKLVASGRTKIQEEFATIDAKGTEKTTEAGRQRLDAASDRDYVVDKISDFVKKGRFPGSAQAPDISARFNSAADRNELSQFVDDIKDGLAKRHIGEVSLKIVDLDTNDLRPLRDEQGKQLANVIVYQPLDREKYLKEATESIRSTNPNFPVKPRGILKEASLISLGAGVGPNSEPLGGFEISYWDKGFYNIYHRRHQP